MAAFITLRGISEHLTDGFHHYVTYKFQYMINFCTSSVLQYSLQKKCIILVRTFIKLQFMHFVIQKSFFHLTLIIFYCYYAVFFVMLKDNLENNFQLKMQG